MFWPPLPPGKEAPLTFNKHVVWSHKTVVNAMRGKKSNIAKGTEPIPFNPYQTKSNPTCCIFLRFWPL